MGLSTFHFKKKITPLKFLIHLIYATLKLPHDGATLNGFHVFSKFIINCASPVQRWDFFQCLDGF